MELIFGAAEPKNTGLIVITSINSTYNHDTILTHSLYDQMTWQQIYEQNL